MENKYPYIGKGLNSGSVVLFFAKGQCLTIDSKSWASEKLEHHRGLDESMFKNITADYLRNTKIRIVSPEHCEFVQKLVFSAGGGWRGPKVDINTRHKEANFLFVDEDLSLTYSFSFADNFAESTYKEIKLPMPPKQASDEWPKVGDDVSWGGDGKSIGYVLSKFGDYAWVRSDDVDDNGAPVTLNINVLSKPPTPLDTLSNSLLRIVSANSRETSGYAAKQIAKAILAGEIKGLVYKGD